VDSNQDPNQPDQWAEDVSEAPEPAADSARPGPALEPPEPTEASTMEWPQAAPPPADGGAPLGGGPDEPDDLTPAPPGPNWRRRVAVVAVAAVVLLGVGFAGYRIGSPGSSSTLATEPIPTPAASSGVTGSAGTLNVTKVAAAVDPAVVDITATDSYQNQTDAGTGMILTSNGEILTNNHVIEGATSITVQVDGTGTKYTANVVGYDATDDVALLQLQSASGLSTVSVGNSSSVAVGLPVIAIGNALDLPGKPTVTSGAVTALNRSITASDGEGTSSEHLTGVIQIDAPLEPGNSGGPLVNSAGKVVGMNTAASSSNSGEWSSASNVGFAIPINRALTIASEIQQGQDSTTVRIGLPAFLGVEVENAGSASAGSGFGGFGGYTPPVDSGALVTNVLANTPAASAGLQAGDVITAVNGSSVSSATALGSSFAADKPGQTVSLTWVDSSDTSHTANVTLTTGPAE